jgi:S-adenosyl methyltransferase
MTWDERRIAEERTGHPYTMADVDITVPNVARVYDAFLGGKDNFTADREFVRQALEIAPKAGLVAQSNRAFLDRVVRYLILEAGLTQFLDIGSGLPTRGNVSEVAHGIDRAIHVVHVDNDPVVYTHSKALLADNKTTDIVVGDVRRPGEIIGNPVVSRLIDFGRPVGLLLFAILHHVADDEDPARIAAELRDAMPAGSYLAISSLRMPGAELPGLQAATVEGEKLLAGTLGSGRWRQEEEILSWFGDWELVDPGLVSLLEWHAPPGRDIPRDELYHTFFGGVAKKP